MVYSMGPKNSVCQQIVLIDVYVNVNLILTENP